MSHETTAARARPVALEDYLAGPADELKTELIYGERVVCPSPTFEHQEVAHNLTHLLRVWVKAGDLGRVSHDLDMVLDDIKNLVYRPDILYVAKEHGSRWQRGRLFGPADLAVEVLSSSDKPSLQRRKFADYERYAVAWYWIFDPDKRTIEENQLVGDAYQCRIELEGDAWFEPGLFPGLRLRLPALLAGDLKAAVQGDAASLV